MNTFLPYPNFNKSAECLDYRRLGKQRVEAWQIYETIISGRKAWSNHPATLMWKSYPEALLEYGIVMCENWISRGYKDTMLTRFLKEYNKKAVQCYEIPKWLGSRKFHASHRSNLLRKDPVHYGQFKWKESADLPYVWPVVITESNSK